MKMTMKDMIYRQQAIDAIMELREARYEWERDASREISTLDAAYCAIEDLPSVDAEPVRHGKWEKTPSNWGSRFECSECVETAVETVMGKPRFIYCPMCGARMDEE